MQPSPVPRHGLAAHPERSGRAALQRGRGESMAWVPLLFILVATVYDLKTREIVAKIRTGARPARISTAILPLNRVNPTGTNMARPGAE